MHRARQHAASQTRERRHRLAHEAARLMAEGGIRDYHQAKLKAAKSSADRCAAERSATVRSERAVERTA